MHLCTATNVKCCADPGTSVYPKNVYEIYAPLDSTAVEENGASPISVRLIAAYPAIEICAWPPSHEADCSDYGH